MSKNEITIVINTFRSHSKIITCLKSINQKYKVIIIENSNDEILKDQIEKNFINTSCLLMGQNLGYAKGNNLGLSKVQTPYALIINPDVLIDTNTIENFFKTASLIKDFAIIGPAVQDEKNLLNNHKKLTQVESVKGFAMFLNLKEFKDIGFFDENFFIYLEEIDLCRRVKNRNKKIYVDPNIIVKHQGGSSHDEKYNYEMELSRNWHWMWSTFYYNKKYYGYFFAFYSILKKLLSSTIKYFFYSICLNNKKKNIYKQRFLGLYNSIIGKPSWYRPFSNN